MSDIPSAPVYGPKGKFWFVVWGRGVNPKNGKPIVAERAYYINQKIKQYGLNSKSGVTVVNRDGAASIEDKDGRVLFVVTEADVSGSGNLDHVEVAMWYVQKIRTMTGGWALLDGDRARIIEQFMTAAQPLAFENKRAHDIYLRSLNQVKSIRADSVLYNWFLVEALEDGNRTLSVREAENVLNKLKGFSTESILKEYRKSDPYNYDEYLKTLPKGRFRELLRNAVMEYPELYPYFKDPEVRDWYKKIADRISPKEVKELEILLAFMIDLVKYKLECEKLVVNNPGQIIPKISKSSFIEHFNYGQALVQKLSTEKAMGTLIAMLSDKDDFVRGEGASLFRYLKGKEDFKKYAVQMREILKRVFETDKNYLVRAIANESMDYLRDGNTSKPLSHNNNYLRFETRFFKHPKQLQWVVNAVRTKAKGMKSGEVIRLLEVGSSFGPEPISIIFAVLEDYEKTPKAWGGFDPNKQFRVLATDINYECLLYLQRGRFCGDDLQGADIDIKKYLAKYFIYDKNDGSYSLKPKLKKMMEIFYIDILDPKNKLRAKPFISVYNVDLYFDHEQQVVGARNVLGLTEKFITCASNRNGTLLTLMQKAKKTGSYDPEYLHLFEKK